MRSDGYIIINYYYQFPKDLPVNRILILLYFTLTTVTNTKITGI